MIYVIATVELIDGKKAEYLSELRKVVPSVRAETGCIDYSPTVDLATDIPVQDPTRENVVTIMERWTDTDALKAHLVAKHMKVYREAIKDCVKQLKVKILEPV